MEGVWEVVELQREKVFGAASLSQKMGMEVAITAWGENEADGTCAV